MLHLFIKLLCFFFNFYIPFFLFTLSDELSKSLDLLFFIFDIFRIIYDGFVDQLFELDDFRPHCILCLSTFLQLAFENCLLSRAFVKKSGYFAHTLIQIGERILLKEKVLILEKEELTFEGL